MYKLLLIDDNADIQQANREYLTEKGYTVDTAYTGMEAITKLNSGAYDCVLLDVMLPDLDGFAICAAARKTIRTPIIFLSAMDTEDDRVRGLMAGGDDYICKPYSLAELGARVYAQIRRRKMDGDTASQPSTSVLRDDALRTITIRGTNIILTEREYRLLSILIEMPGRVFTPDELMEEVWGVKSSVDPANLRVIVGRIRAKLHGAGVGNVENVFNEGYYYEPPAEGTR